MTRLGIGDFTVLSELGAGAGSRVFHIRRKADQKDYALKIVPAGRYADPNPVAHLKHEFRVGQMLDYPNIVKVHAFELRRDWLFRPTAARLLLEYIPGQSLDTLWPIEMGSLLRILERTAAALEHMHKRGVFHADLKPKNLILDDDVGIKVIDFGLAWIEGESKNRVQGTPDYMAPETAAHKRINASTDIYNFGATMYFVATRRTLLPPFPGVILTARAHAARILPVQKLNAQVPSELCDLIHQCISYEPSQRPQHASEIRLRLDRLARRRR